MILVSCQPSATAAAFDTLTQSKRAGATRTRRYATILLWLFPWPLNAQTIQASGYEIFYSLFPSTFLDAQTADSYGIVRSRAQAILNVSLRAPSERAEGTAVQALVSGSVFDLIHHREIEFREIRESTAIYYIANISFHNGETLYFTVNVDPSPRFPRKRFEFIRTFYRD